MADSYQTTGRFAPTGEHEDIAVNLLAERIERSPDNGKELYEAVQQVVAERAPGSYSFPARPAAGE